MKKLISTCLFLTLSSITLAQSAENLFQQAVKMQQKGDTANAMKLFENTCDQGHMKSCHNVGVLYGKNTAKAQAFYEKACNGNIGESCYTLAYIHFREAIGETLFGVNEDEDIDEKELEKRKKASEKAAEEHSKKMEEYIIKSCHLGYQPACDMIDKK
ncbi:MAG: sel1 repeat family protein [Neisseriaceae bacterium]|nr:sel1 repeat family protein [Neisseriaceae bacterium]